MSLQDSVAVVTGGNSGIGRAIALGLAGAGARVALAARRRPELEAVVREIEGRDGEALAVPCDVVDPQHVAELHARVASAWGPCDILINSAGVAESHKFIDHPDEIWHRTLAVNLTGAYFVCKAFVPDMVGKGYGRIINIASVAGKSGGRYIAAYTASKHGLLGLTRALAVELAQHNITVNAICPGYVDTPMTHQSVARIARRTGRPEAEVLQFMQRTNLQGRLIQPEEIVPLALLLAAPEASGITGQAIDVDGGSLMA